MGKPFKLMGDVRANVGRGRDGKFTRLEQVSPLAVTENAKAEGDSLRDADRRERVPDHPVASKGQADGDDVVYEETIPWPESSRHSDANVPPMKLRG